MKVNFTSKTKLYGVIGDPIAHSLSPVFQNHFIEQKNIDAIYIPLKISTHTLDGSLELLKNNFAGFNVTIPHKESIIPYLDEIDPLAMEYGAVNTVKVVDNKLIGYNTDGIGFTRSIENIDVDLKGKQVLLLGAGGAARVIALEIVKLGGRLTIANRNIHRGQRIKDELKKLYNVSINVVSLDDVNRPFNIIINSTSVGMYPNVDKLPIGPNILEDAELVYDVIYNPFETKLLKLGSKLGAKVMNGLPMLIYQGLKSSEIWTGELATRKEEEEIYRKLERKISIDKRG